MNIFSKKKIAAVMALMIVVLGFAFPVNALASPVILGISTNSIKVGDSFSVSVSGADSSNLSLHYDGTMVTLTGQNGASLDGNTLTIAAKSATFTFTAKQSGSAGFVASSDKYERSSAVVSIAASTEDNAQTDADTSQTDTEGTEASENDADTSASDSSDDKDSVSDSSEELPADTTQDVSDTDTVSQKHGTSSSDLSFKQLITDRRMTLVIAVLLAVIIALIIRITTLHYQLADLDYDDDDIDFDEEEKKISEKEKEEEKKKPLEPVTEKKNEKKPVDIALDDIDEEKLTMPKAPKKPNEKLKLEDLNNI